MEEEHSVSESLDGDSVLEQPLALHGSAKYGRQFININGIKRSRGER